MKKTDLEIGPKNIPIEKIERNPQNPRLVWTSESLKGLLKSISEVGILVPLIVYHNKEEDKYFLLDGERRFRCAKELNFKTVPVNIISRPSKLQNILEMFNIHNVRRDWSLIEIAWKLKTIIKEIDNNDEMELSRLTSLSKYQIRRAKILLEYPYVYQKLAYKYVETEHKEGLKSDFLIELAPIIKIVQNEYSDIFKKYKYKIVDKLIKKFKSEKSGGIKAVTDFRLFSKVLRNKDNLVKKEKIKEVFERVLNDHDFSIEDAYNITVKHAYDAKSINRYCNRLEDILSSIKLKNEDEKLIESLSRIKDIIDRKLKELKEV